MRVRLTAYFLKATGQTLGGEGASVWTVVDCGCGLCATGMHCAVNECTGEYWLDGDPRYRHMALGNLEEYGKLPNAADMVDAHAPDPLPTKRSRRRK